MPTSEERKKEKLPIFQKRFNELRGNKSQDEFAKFIGVSRATIGFYENGERVPDAITLIKIADACDVDVEFLLGRSDIRRGSADDRVLQKRFGFNDNTIKIFDELATGKSGPEISISKKNFHPDNVSNLKFPEPKDYVGFINLLFQYEFDEIIRFLFEAYTNFVEDKKEEENYYEGRHEFDAFIRKEMQQERLNRLSKLSNLERGIEDEDDFDEEELSEDDRLAIEKGEAFIVDSIIQPMRIAYFDAEGSFEFMLNRVRKNLEMMLREMEGKIEGKEDEKDVQTK